MAIIGIDIINAIYKHKNNTYNLNSLAKPSFLMNICHAFNLFHLLSFTGQPCVS